MAPNATGRRQGVGAAAAAVRPSGVEVADNVPAVPSDKRARQRANRDVKQAAQAKVDNRRKLVRNGVVIVVIAAVVVGTVYLITRHNSTKSATTTTTTTTTQPVNAAQAAATSVAVKAGCPANPDTRVNVLTWTSAPPMTINTDDTYEATVTTTVGTFVITLDAKTSPVAVNNFVFLAHQGYYKCNTFWRVIPGFMNQTGDPTSTGTGTAGYSFTEAGPTVATPQYPLGSVAMANSDNPPTTTPKTNSAQFFVVAGPEGESLPPDYVLFGQVTSGMSVVDAINAQGNSSANANGSPPDVIQRILSVTITTSTAPTTTTSSSTTSTTGSTTTTTTAASTTTTAATTTTTVPPTTTTS
jgi:cyclophilin family peptidyl-prolyl cis-trans isomerase